LCPDQIKSKEIIMIKLVASFSKKLPAEVDYSSQSFLASVEVELPAGVEGKELQARRC
jgi:hypothetical protein